MKRPISKATFFNITSQAFSDSASNMISPQTKDLKIFLIKNGEDNKVWTEDYQDKPTSQPLMTLKATSINTLTLYQLSVTTQKRARSGIENQGKHAEDLAEVIRQCKLTFLSKGMKLTSTAPMSA